MTWPHLSEALPQLATPTEVALLLAIPEKTVRNWIRDGKLPAVKVGARWFVHVPKLRAMLEASPA